MKETIINIMLAAMLPALFFAGTGCSRTVEVSTPNPVIYGDVPDPDIIRVGDDYYMTSTTMHLLPGVPVMHSTDLINWEIVSYIYDQLEDNDKASLLNGEHSYGGGSWASSIKYAGGQFHVCFVANEQHKSYIYHTSDLTSGEWTRSEFDLFFHDPALFEDEDGSEWVVYGNGVLRITQLTDNFHAVKEDGIVDSVLLNLRSRELQLNAEGSHLYKRNGYYYLFDIDWPRGGIRREICNRSTNILGPYEQKTVLYTTLNEGKGGFSANGVAQGGIVDTPDGDWYAFLFQDHGPLGRCPVLVPMEWSEDGWPVMAGGEAAGAATGKTYGMAKLPEVGVMPAEVTVKAKSVTVPNWFGDDEFEYETDKLALAWQWNHNPVAEGWSVTERPGWLRLKSVSLAPNILRARNSPSQRLPGPRCETEVLLDFSALQAGDRAGICAFQSNYASVGIAVDENGAKHLSVLQRTGGGNKSLLGADDDGAEQMLDVPVPEGVTTVALKISYVFDPEDTADTKRDFARLAYSFSGNGDWTDCGIELRMRYTLDIFMGYRTFLYCYSTLATGGYADFDYYRVSVN